jgi:hypothetical protein
MTRSSIDEALGNAERWMPSGFHDDPDERQERRAALSSEERKSMVLD